MVTFACKLMLNCTMQLEVREISVVSLFHWELQLFPRHIPSALRPAGAVVEVTKGKLGLYFFFWHFVGGAYLLLQFVVVIFA
jgi:hypothetical protein